MNPAASKNKFVFEHDVCGRCGGSGQYSYNSVNGTTCFGCGGRGYLLTNRGLAAFKYFIALQQCNASEVNVGDFIVFEMDFFRCNSHVVSIESRTINGSVNGVPHHAELIYFSGIRKKTGEAINFGVPPGEKVRRCYSRQDQQAQIEEALAFQSTLTKTGSPAECKSALHVIFP